MSTPSLKKKSTTGPYLSLSTPKLRGKVGIWCRFGVTVTTWYMELRYPPDLRFKQVLEATSQRGAEELATAALKKVNEEGHEKMKAALAPFRKGPGQFCSVGELLEAYLEGTLVAQKDSMVRAANCLRLVVADALGMDRGKPGWKAAVDERSCSVLTLDLVSAYFTARQRAAGLPEMDVSAERQENVAHNSILNNAKLVFTRKSLLHKLRKLALPDLTGFLRHPYLPEPPARPVVFDPADVRRMTEALPALKIADPECWLFLSWTQRCGLRNCESLAARDTWLLREKGQWMIEIKPREADPAQGIEAFTVKNSECGKIPVPDEIMAFIAGRKGLLVAPQESATQRTDEMPRRANRFMRQFFPKEDFNKGVYLLRAQWATAMRTKHDLETSQRGLRHAPGSKTAQRHYAADQKQVPLLEMSDLVPVEEGK